MSMMQFIGSMEGVPVRLGLHLVQDDGCNNCDVVWALVVFKEISLHVLLQSAGCIACRSAYRRVTNLGYIFVHFAE